MKVSWSEGLGLLLGIKSVYAEADSILLAHKPTPDLTYQFEIFESLSYCFEGTIEFDVKASFASRPVSRLIR